MVPRTTYETVRIRKAFVPLVVAAIVGTTGLVTWMLKELYYTVKPSASGYSVQAATLDTTRIFQAIDEIKEAVVCTSDESIANRQRIAVQEERINAKEKADAQQREMILAYLKDIKSDIQELRADVNQLKGYRTP